MVSTINLLLQISQTVKLTIDLITVSMKACICMCSIWEKIQKHLSGSRQLRLLFNNNSDDSRQKLVCIKQMNTHRNTQNEQLNEDLLITIES